jgi:hypothetical protein
MLAFIMIVVLMWSRDDRSSWATSGWLEAARKSRFDEVVAPAGPAATGPGHGSIDDDEHLAAYNAYLARLNRPGGDGTG